MHLPEATKEHQSAMKKYDHMRKRHAESIRKHNQDLADLWSQHEAATTSEKEKERILKRITALESQAPEAIPPPPKPRMHADEIILLLRLATSLKLLLAPMTTALERKRGADLLYDYLLGYKQLYGADAMVPNHHFASHIPSQLEEFATIYEIWAFLPERLNMVLKGTNLNNRRGGQQEVTMMREYYRDLALRAMASDVASDRGDMSESAHTTCLVADRLLARSQEGRGAAEGAAVTEAHTTVIQDDALLGLRVSTGAKATHPVTLSHAHAQIIMRFYNTFRDHLGGRAQLYFSHDRHAPPGAIFFEHHAHELSYVILNGRRITPRDASAIVKVSLPSRPDLAGDVIRLLYHKQTGFARPQIFAEMLWMDPQPITLVAGNPWRALYASSEYYEPGDVLTIS
ncbi:hypothetical protein BD414DRAFT_461603 [Trametes punicea]|nr:hypothetical protein BD414DRAFT_461603 [Trametes punicea]